MKNILRLTTFRRFCPGPSNELVPQIPNWHHLLFRNMLASFLNCAFFCDSIRWPWTTSSNFFCQYPLINNPGSEDPWKFWLRNFWIKYLVLPWQNKDYLNFSLQGANLSARSTSSRSRTTTSATRRTTSATSTTSATRASPAPSPAATTRSSAKPPFMTNSLVLMKIKIKAFKIFIWP